MRSRVLPGQWEHWSHRVCLSLQALTITKDTAGNVVVAKAIEGVHDGVKEGEAMVTPLQACGIFPGMVISMVDVGEETGQLPEMMLKIANVYDDEVDNAVSASDCRDRTDHDCISSGYCWRNRDGHFPSSHQDDAELCG